jgi:hypothetical protein
MNEMYQPRYVEDLPIFMVCIGVLERLQANYDSALARNFPVEFERTVGESGHGCRTAAFFLV